MLEAEKLNQINEKKNKLQEANQKRQEYNNNFIQSTKETLEQKMETFESNREAKLRALQEKLKEHVRFSLIYIKLNNIDVFHFSFLSFFFKLSKELNSHFEIKNV